MAKLPINAEISLFLRNDLTNVESRHDSAIQVILMAQLIILQADINLRLSVLRSTSGRLARPRTMRTLSVAVMRWNNK